jgi:hypothetical protein
MNDSQTQKETPTTDQRVEIRPRGSMHFAFTLSMPSTGGASRWSGEERVYVRVKSFTQRSWKETLAKLVGYHSYAFGDGWRAAVTVRVVDADEKKKLLKKSAGFCGYDWMINSLIDHGEIRS